MTAYIVINEHTLGYLTSPRRRRAGFVSRQCRRSRIQSRLVSFRNIARSRPRCVRKSTSSTVAKWRSLAAWPGPQPVS
jgi:hypothetical protein